MDSMQPSAQQQANFFQGNPAPLQQKVQQAGQKPNGIPNDLQGAIALEDVLKGIQAGQNSQALQNAGQKPTVVDSIRMALAQTLAPHAQQAQMQPPQPAPGPQGIATPPQAQQAQAQPQGGPAQGINTLPSGINGMAGGGIVAFSGEDGSEVEGDPDEMTDANGVPYTHLWHAAGSSKKNTPYAESVGNAMEVPIEMLKRLIGAPNQKDYGQRKAEDKPHEVSAAARADDRTPRPSLKGTTNTAPQIPPEVALMLAGAGGRSSTQNTYQPARSSGLEAALDKDLMAQLGKDPEAQADARIAKNREMSGIDSILADRQKRIDATEALNKETESHYSPFRNAMEGILNRDRRVGGLGMIAGAAGQGYYAGQDANDKDRKTNLATVNKLYDELLTAKASGNMDLVKVREQELAAFLRQHETAESTTGTLLGVREQAAARRQAAHESALARAEGNNVKVQTALANAIKGDPRVTTAEAALKQVSPLMTGKYAAAKVEVERAYAQATAEHTKAFQKFGAVPFASTPSAAPQRTGTRIKFDIEGNHIN